MSTIISILDNNFGNFGGGGKSGSSIVGNEGKSGNLGISKVGKTGISGNCTLNAISTLGTFGKFNSGKLGKIIGLDVMLYSGKVTLNQALILCKSNIISGHLGNLIIGIFGI
ncbi:MAG: hypothetical protein Q8M44_06245, partial [bacterium]|nr:hypothetical protein [bacterium]